MADLTGAVIDSRDLEERRVELEEEQVELEEAGDELSEEDAEELSELEALSLNCPDWKYGATLIRDDYFQEYAREFAENIGAIDDNARWPATCIDWEKAANELATDYTSVEWQGDDYYVR